MKGGVLFTGFCGVFAFATSALADPPLASVEKAYRLLQSVAAQLHEVRGTLSPRQAAPAASALAAAEEQVRIAFTHCCRTLYAAQLKAAKAALAKQEHQRALHHLLKADETLGQCTALAPATEPQDGQEETPETQSALARR